MLHYFRVNMLLLAEYILETHTEKEKVHDFYIYMKNKEENDCKIVGLFHDIYFPVTTL